MRHISVRSCNYQSTAKQHHYHHSGIIIVDVGSSQRRSLKVEVLIFTAHAHGFKLNVIH